MSEPDQYAKATSTFIRRLGRTWFARWGLAPSDPNEPVGMVASNPRAEALEEAVFALMDQELPEERIIEELRKKASKRRDLVAAARRLNMENEVRELSWYNEAWRLLIAASGARVEDPSPEELAKFEVLDQLFEESTSTAFPKLVECEPALGEIAERLDHSPKPAVASFNDLARLLDHIVGPSARSTDPIIRSHLAAHICRNHLADISGLLDDEAPDDDFQGSDTS
jgi:hypothetical protein